MATMLKSIHNKYFYILLILVSFLSCEEECLDMPLIESKTEEMQSWYTNSDIATRTVTSSIGISDEVSLTHDFQNFGDTIWDDCGNASESERNIVSYNFFNFPFSIEYEFYKQGEENGFEFRVRYNIYSASYKFTSETSSLSNTIEYLTEYELNDVLYSEAFRITFNETQNDTEIKEIIIVKDLGIIYIHLNSGVTLDFQ